MPGLVGIRAARGTINHENKRGRREEKGKGRNVLKRRWFVDGGKEKKDDHRS